MNLRVLALLTFSVLTVACHRGRRSDTAAADASREEQRIADERYRAELGDVERRAAEREAAARAAETDLERARIAEERESLEREKERLVAEQRRIEEKRLSDEKAVADDAAREAGKQARVEQTLEFFYEPLDPHGDWVEVERYGYCWRPAAARNSRWGPYVDGHWAWTDYGWTWVSNEPFGWATYHYGRWTRVKRLGWVWVPGSEWASAWVSWRRSDQHVGWAPLPPDAHSGAGFTAAVDSYYDIGPGAYAFVDVQDFGEPTYVGRVVEPKQNVTIINKTVNVTNVTYRKVENKTVVFNGGPEINVINERSRKPARTVRVERVSDPKAGGSIDAKANVLRLAAPEFVSAAKLSKAPRKVSERAKAEELDHGWQEADEPTRQKVRAQQTAEAKRAEETLRALHSRRGERDDLRTTPRSADDQRSPEAVATKEAATAASGQPKASPPPKAIAPESRANQQEQAERRLVTQDQPAPAGAAKQAGTRSRNASPNDRSPDSAAPREPRPDVAPPSQQPTPDAYGRTRRRNADRRANPAPPRSTPTAPLATPAPQPGPLPAIHSLPPAATPPPARTPPTASDEASNAPPPTSLPTDAPADVSAATPVATPAPAAKRKSANRPSREESPDEQQNRRRLRPAEGTAN